MGPFTGILLGLLLLLGGKCIKLVREYQPGVSFRLGRLKGVMGPGMYWVIPFVGQKVQLDVRTKTVSIEPQETVTADSVTIKVNAVLY
jgi:regulator of protease activity HflC (stomatin/prohibitin superfamily)